MHTDKPERNVIGSIIHLGGDEEWGLVVEDLSGEVHEVFMNPGDAFFYESAKVYHGRIKPFNGSFYCGVFCHYVPEVWGEWDREGHVAIERSWADEGGGESELKVDGSGVLEKGGGWGEEEWIVWSDGEIVKKDYKRAWGDAWEEKFNALLSHKVEFGGCNFPQNVVTEDGVKLGAWVKKQRANKERLSAERIEKLNNAGFVWRKYESAWQANFLKLLDYKKEFGDVLVPERFVTDDGKRLGAWVTKQRFRRERLSGEQREKLEVSGFVWDASAQAGERLKGEEKKKNGGEREETLSRRVGSWDDGTHVHLFRGNRYNDRWLELWEWKYIRLLEFKEEFGHVLVPTDYVTKDGRRLGKWASDQRTMKKNDRLSVERFEKLEGAHFVWDAQEAAWEDMFDKLLKHKEEFGDLFVPKDYVTKDGRRLGNWVGLQRKNKKNDVLSAERVEKLNKIGLVWGVLEAAWEANYLKLVEYTEEFGHALVPRDPPYVTEDGANLGGWVGVQRNNRDIISAERVERLNILNFVWDPHEAAWEENWKKLLEYKEEFGDVLVTTNVGTTLGNWVCLQRQLKKNDRLSAQRFERLEGVDFVWDPHESSWEGYYEKLLRYIEENGDALVPISYVTEDGVILGTWVQQQRQWKKKESISAERVKKLEAVDFVWGDLLDAQWEDYYEKLLRYIEENGDALVLRSFVMEDGFNLGNWVGSQRQCKTNGIISAERVEKLEEVDFVWNPLVAQWDSNYEALLKYQEEFGNALVMKGYVTADGVKLGQWVSDQRQSKKDGRLSDERFGKLEGVDFVWNVPEWKAEHKLIKK